MTGSFRQQQTIAHPVRVEGFGYWSGRDVSVEFRPAPPDHGLVFARTDLQPQRRVEARVDHRIDVPRRTCLRHGDVGVEMVEHVLAALHGLRIDNCEIRVDSPEMPGCDGSSMPFVAVLQDIVVPQAAVRRRLRVPKPIRVGDQRVWAEARPSTGDAFVVEAHIDYGERGPIGRQSLLLPVTPDSFRRELAAARTFLLEAEADWLRSQGLGARVTCRDLLVFGDQGPIDNPLRFGDECVRHKALDMIGDLALAGCELVGHFIAHCSGHRLNALLVAAVQDAIASRQELRRSA